MQATVAHKTIIIATHDLHFIEEISDMIYVFSPEKNIVRCGKALEILQDTALLEENNLIHVHAHRHKDTVHIHPHQHLHHHH
jgi:cobalt/nickel transport system ATP-binding protein